MRNMHVQYKSLLPEHFIARALGVHWLSVNRLSSNRLLPTYGMINCAFLILQSYKCQIFVSLSGSQTVCCVRVLRLRASHARTLINSNPFSCLCMRACLPASHFWWINTSKSLWYLIIVTTESRSELNFHLAGFFSLNSIHVLKTTFTFILI